MQGEPAGGAQSHLWVSQRLWSQAIRFNLEGSKPTVCETLKKGLGKPGLILFLSKIYELEGVGEQNGVGGAEQRERETETPHSAGSLMQDSPRIPGSLPELKADVQSTEPPRCPKP